MTKWRPPGASGDGGGTASCKRPISSRCSKVSDSARQPQGHVANQCGSVGRLTTSPIQRGVMTTGSIVSATLSSIRTIARAWGDTGRWASIDAALPSLRRRRLL